MEALILVAFSCLCLNGICQCPWHARAVEPARHIGAVHQRSKPFGRGRLRPIFSSSATSTSAIFFDFGQFRLGPISISANFGVLNLGSAGDAFTQKRTF